ncbi:TPA: hypothetical protein J4Q85_004581 [Escherichia coli]|nr:hypothetical protein [Escherichia coli]
MKQVFVDRILLSGTQREKDEYLRLCAWKDCRTFFGAKSEVMRGRASPFHPMRSLQYLKVHSSNWRNRYETTEWWQWLETFRPDAGLEPHRYLIDPMANVWDCRRKTYIKPLLDPAKDERYRYLEFWLDRPEPEPGKIVTPDVVTRGRLIAYRYPHLAWCDYFGLRYRHSLRQSLSVPGEILRDVVGYDADDNKVNTGMYSRQWNNVTRRFDNGKVAKRDMGHNQHVRGLRPLEVDHKDRDKFNDLPSNIRWADRQMNLQNRNMNKVHKNAQKVHRHSHQASHSTP